MIVSAKIHFLKVKDKGNDRMIVSTSKSFLKVKQMTHFWRIIVSVNIFF